MSSPPLALLLSAVVLGSTGAQEQPMEGLSVAPAPVGEVRSELYTVKVDGQAVPVYACRVSAIPFNQVWPGYQRPLEQTELAGFASWDQSRPVKVEIESSKAIESVTIRPLSRGLKPTVEGRQISFELASPGQVVVEVNDSHGALHLFANPPEANVPKPDDDGVLYFGPGVHRPGKVELQTGQTVYLAAGSVVYGSLQGTNVSDVRICGRGIIDQAPFERGFGGAVRLRGCSNVSVEGLVMRDPDVWCLAVFACDNITIQNVKLVGLWRYNADGIDICNTRHVTVEDCFVRAYDDALVVKGLAGAGGKGDDQPVRDVTFRRCVLWCDWGRAMELGAETCAPEMANVAFEDSDIIRTTHIALDIQHGDRAKIHDIRFERIRVEMEEPNPRPKMQRSPEDTYDPGPDGFLPTLAVIVIRGTNYSKDQVRGTVRNVVFQDIDITAPGMPASTFVGADPEHTVEGVVCRGWRFNGQPLTSLEAMHLKLGAHVSGVTVEE